MYKLMLVDDESDIREGLQEVIHFEELGFEVVGEAANGLEAIPLCEKLEPDLIVTDIRMPLMDGLTMCRKIQKALPTAHFVILSGYDDFEYARQAIEFKAIGYILKPISSVEFTEMLQNAREKLDEEYALRRDFIRLRQHFQASLPLLRSALLSGLLSGGVSPSTAVEDAKRYDLSITAPQYALALMRVQPVQQPTQDDITDPDLLSFAALNISKEVLESLCKVALFHYDGLLAALLMLPDDTEASFAESTDWMEQVQKTAEHFLHARLVIGMGAPCKRLEDLPSCARQALSALEQCTLSSGETVLCITDLEPGARTEIAANETLLRKLSNALKVSDSRQAHEALDCLLDDCAAAKPTPQNYRAYLLEVITEFLRTARDMALDMDVIGNEPDNLMTRLLIVPDLTQARETLYGLCNRMLDVIAENRAGASAQIANEALVYLQAHFHEEDMSLERLSRKLHISPSYFSVVFKKERHETVHQVLTRLRMDRAMTLLTTSERKTSDIARAVGITDPSYFSYAFKKYFGISPSQARAGRGGEI